MGKKVTTTALYKDVYFLGFIAIGVAILLQSESPWQRNDAITFFYLSLCFSVRAQLLKDRTLGHFPLKLSGMC